MVNISNLTKRYLQDSFLLQEYLQEGLINYAALAEQVQPKIEKELGKKVKVSAIMMALRRHAEKLKTKKTEISFKDSEIILKTGLCDISVSRSVKVSEILKQIHKIINYEKGDTLNIIQGDSDISIVVNSKYKNKIKKLLKGHRILNTEDNLVSVTARFGMKYLHTPGVTYTFLRALVMEEINLIEIISSAVETTFIIDKKDASKAYNALDELIKIKTENNF
jgi:aspartokinase